MSPYLTPADRKLLLVAAGTCPTCGAPRMRHYCRSCDVFFYVCTCPRPPVEPPGNLYRNDHSSCRTYAPGDLDP